MIIIETCPKCGGDLVDIMLASYPPIHEKRCYHCGWGWTDQTEQIMRIPFGGNSNYETYKSNAGNIIALRHTPIKPSDIFYKSSPCANCSNNPANGGSGICNCVLGGLDLQLT